MNRRIFLRTLTGVAACGGAVSACALSVHYCCRGDVVLVLEGADLVQHVSARHPRSPVLSHDGRFLFVVNNVAEYRGLPTGATQSFAVCPTTGRLTPLSQRGLSLSSTGPRSCALSHDGRFLVVAAYEGGTYNVLPVSAAGEIDAPVFIFKDIGRGTPARPHSVAFDPSGRFLIARDGAADAMRVFRFHEGELTLDG